MRVLLDENLDVQLKNLFDPDFKVVTVRERRWNGVKNGALLRNAQEEFDVFVTMDKKLKHQQNLSGIRLGIVVIRARSNAFRDMEELMPRVKDRAEHPTRASDRGGRPGELE